MKSIAVALTVFCAGAVAGVVLFRMTLVGGDWLHTEFDYDQELKQQRVEYYSTLCDVIGEAQWVESGKSLAHLRRADNMALRARFANRTTQDMRVEDALETLVTSKCAKMLGTS